MSSAPKQARFGSPKQENATVSYWLETVQDDPLLNHRTTPEMPHQADIIIIGSGLTGTLVAKHCVETWPSKKILVLEARQFCSGATGRNAGHCKPDQWRGFTRYEQDFGTEQALKILANEQQTWFSLVSYVRENNVNCDLWVGNTLDVPTTPDAARATKNTFDRFKAAGGKVDHIDVTNEPAKAAEISRIKGAQACYAWPASTMHPWKLAAHVMRSNLSKGVNFQTKTPVITVTPSENAGKWTVATERGDLECSQVVHATNAYSSALEPTLRGLISPTPHICAKIQPPVTFQGDDSLQNSYGVLLPKGSLISINPRQTTRGPVVFAGRNQGQPELVKWLEQHPDRCTDDGLTGFQPINIANEDFATSQLVGWADTNAKPSDIYKESWSGIIGLSSDGVPLVGELPGKPGQWVCAGHHGQ